MPNTHLATRRPRAGNMAAEEHIARMVVKARAAMALYARDIAAHGQAAQPQTNRPLTGSTGHSRSLMLWIVTAAGMIICQTVRSTSYA